MKTIGYENAHYRVWISGGIPHPAVKSPELYCREMLERFLVGLPVEDGIEVTDLNNNPVRRFIGDYGLAPLKGAVTHEQARPILAPVDREPPVQVVSAAPDEWPKYGLNKIATVFEYTGERKGRWWALYSTGIIACSMKQNLVETISPDRAADLLQGYGHTEEAQRVRKAAPKPDVLQGAICIVNPSFRESMAVVFVGAKRYAHNMDSGSDGWTVETGRGSLRDVGHALACVPGRRFANPTEYIEILDSLRAHLTKGGDHD
jgi:hypothetical protein